METGSGRERWTTEVLEKSDSETIKPCSGHSAFSEGCIELLSSIVCVIIVIL